MNTFDFEVPAISCGHCARAVTEAVHELDPQAAVAVDVPARKVQVRSGAPLAALVEALKRAGYAPSELPS